MLSDRKCAFVDSCEGDYPSKVSIVIVLYNKLQRTKAILKSFSQLQTSWWALNENIFTCAILVAISAF